MEINNSASKDKSGMDVEKEIGGHIGNGVHMKLGADKIYCDNCLKNKSEQVNAVRFCLLCNLCICSDCALDFHDEHAKEAKIRIEEILSKGKEKLITLTTNLENMLKETIIGKKIDEKSREIKKEVETNFAIMKKNVDIIQGKLNLLLEKSDELKGEVSTVIERKYEELVNNPEYRRVSETKLKFSLMLKKWNQLPKLDRIEVFKNMKQIEEEIKADVQQLRNSSDSVGGSNKMDSLEKEIKNYMGKVNFTDKLSQMDKLIMEIQAQINKVSEEMKKMENITVRVNESPKSNINAKPEKEKVPTQVVTISPMPPELGHNYEFLISLKTRGSEISIFNIRAESDRVHTLKIDDSMFLDPKPVTIFPPEYTKFVNLGSSILVTGGIEKGNAISNCFIIQVSSDGGVYTASISNYESMNTSRERHNIIFLEDINSVLVCGGFYTKTAEMTGLNSPHKWIKLNSMREQRANATMLYCNNKYVYCFGGFQIMEREGKEKSTGTYLGSCEMINIKSKDANWTFVDLETLYSVNLKLCAMGVIHCAPNKILLVGGYDGFKYLSEVVDVTTTDDGITKMVPLGRKSGLVKGVIFPSSSKFINRNENIFINFDVSNRLVVFNLKENDFSL